MLEPTDRSTKLFQRVLRNMKNVACARSSENQINLSVIILQVAVVTRASRLYLSWEASESRMVQ